MLQKCFDFGVLFSAVCGRRQQSKASPVEKGTLARVGQLEFRQCVSFVCKLSHVVEVAKKDNLEVDETFADIIFLESEVFYHGSDMGRGNAGVFS